MTQRHGSKKKLSFWFSLKLRAKPGTLSWAVVVTIHSFLDSDINYSLHTLSFPAIGKRFLDPMFRDEHGIKCGEEGGLLR